MSWVGAGGWFYGPFALVYLGWFVDMIVLGVTAAVAYVHEQWWPEPGHPNHPWDAAEAPGRTTLIRTANQQARKTAGEQFKVDSRIGDVQLDGCGIQGKPADREDQSRNLTEISPLLVAVSADLQPDKLFAVFTPPTKHIEAVQERINKNIPPSLRSQYRSFPNVIIQLPMFNEEVYCESVIEHAAKVLWPPDRKLVMVCDDTDDPAIRKRIDRTVLRLHNEGHAVCVVRRASRLGYKAGNMLAGMLAVSGRYEYAAVFDADFAPKEDFIFQMVYPMMQDPTLAFTQSRWTWVNPRANMLTFLQRVMMDYHFAVEQRSRSWRRVFFGFNGTAGVWRVAAMDAVGGWHVDTTVEDLDLSMRAYLAGWKFKFSNHVLCPSELPSTMDSYRAQQFRWMAGPMQVFRKYFTPATLLNNKLPLESRLYALHFLWRYLQTGLLTLYLLAMAPLSLLYDPWAAGAPAALLAAGAVIVPFPVLPFTPFSLLYIVQNVVWHHFKTVSILLGLLDLKRTDIWTVTKKCGAAKSDATRRGWSMKPPSPLEAILCVYYGVFAALHAARGGFVLASVFATCSIGLGGCALGDTIWPS